MLDIRYKKPDWFPSPKLRSYI